MNKGQETIRMPSIFKENPPKCLDMEKYKNGNLSLMTRFNFRVIVAEKTCNELENRVE